MTIDKGWLEDEIVISLTGTDVTKRCEKYSVKCSVFQQPSQFSVTVGAIDSAVADLDKHHAGAPFELRLQRWSGGGTNWSIDLDVPLQTGRLDAVDVPETAETTIEFRGRDNIAALFDSYFIQEDSFTEATFYDITAKQMEAVGFPAAKWLFTGETGRTKAITNKGGGMRSSGKVTAPATPYFEEMLAWTPNSGADGGASMKVVKVSAPQASKPSLDATGVLIEDATGGQPKLELKTLKATVGQQRYGWLKEQYKRVGLFLWCMPDGGFLLSQPNTDQEPAFRIQRLINGQPGETNVLSGGLRSDTVQRYSHTFVYGRAGGGKDGRKRIVGKHVDEDMVEAGLIKQISYDEPDVKTQKAADYLARRYAADARRSSQSLTYLVAGHSAPSLISPGERFPFYVNCMVSVNDEKLGIVGDYYLGEVEFMRDKSSTARLTLYSPLDLVFAEEAA